MKYLIKSLYYSNDKNPTLYLMEEVNGSIKYRNVFTNIYYPTNQINVIGNLLSIIKSNNLELIITDINGKIDYYADIDKLNYILKVLTAQKALTKNAEMKYNAISNQVAEHVTNLSGLDPKDSKAAIKAGQRDEFKHSISSSAATSLKISGDTIVTLVSPMFLKALHDSHIKNDKLQEFVVRADINGIKEARNKIKEETKPDFQLLLRKQK